VIDVKCPKTNNNWVALTDLSEILDSAMRAGALGLREQNNILALCKVKAIYGVVKR